MKVTYFSIFNTGIMAHTRGGHITCRGNGYVPPIWVGLWAQNSLNKGPFSGRFSINMDGLSSNWRRMGRFPPKSIIKVTASFGN